MVIQRFISLAHPKTPRLLLPRSPLPTPAASRRYHPLLDLPLLSMQSSPLTSISDVVKGLRRAREHFPHCGHLIFALINSRRPCPWPTLLLRLWKLPTTRSPTAHRRNANPVSLGCHHMMPLPLPRPTAFPHCPASSATAASPMPPPASTATVGQDRRTLTRRRPL